MQEHNHFYQVTFPNLVDWQLDYASVLRSDLALFPEQHVSVEQEHYWVHILSGDAGVKGINHGSINIAHEVNDYTALFSLKKKGLLIKLFSFHKPNNPTDTHNYFMDGKHQKISGNITWKQHDPNAWTTLKAINPNDYV